MVTYKNRTKNVCNWPHSVIVWFLYSVDCILLRDQVILWLSRHTCLLARSRICWPKSVGAPWSCFSAESGRLLCIRPDSLIWSSFAWASTVELATYCYSSERGHLISIWIGLDFQSRLHWLHALKNRDVRGIVKVMSSSLDDLTFTCECGLGGWPEMRT